MNETYETYKPHPVAVAKIVKLGFTAEEAKRMLWDMSAEYRNEKEMAGK